MASQNGSAKNSRGFDDSEMTTFLEIFIDGLQTLQDDLRGPRDRGSTDYPQATRCLNTLLKTDKDCREILMDYAEEKGLLPSIESTKRGVRELISFHAIAFSETLSSLESCTAQIFPDNADQTVQLGEVLKVPNIMENSQFLSFLDPVIEHMANLSCSDGTYANHCYDVTKKLYAGTIAPENTECHKPTFHKPRYLIAMTYLTRLPMYKDYTLRLLDALKPRFKTAIRAKFHQANIQTYNENVEKLHKRIEDLFTNYKEKRFKEAVLLLTDDFNDQIDKTYSKLTNVYKSGMIRKYLESGDEEDLDDDMLENHCQILRNLYNETYWEPNADTIPQMLDLFLKKFIEYMFQYKMIADDVDE